MHDDVWSEAEGRHELRGPAPRLCDQVFVEEKSQTAVQEERVAGRKEHAPDGGLHELLTVRACPSFRLEPFEMRHRDIVRGNLDLAVLDAKHAARTVEVDILRSGSQDIHYADARHGIARRSRRARPQCESTPRSESTTMPTGRVLGGRSFT